MSRMIKGLVREPVMKMLKIQDTKVQTLRAKGLCLLHVCTSYLSKKLNIKKTERSKPPFPRKLETDFKHMFHIQMKIFV